MAASMSYETRHAAAAESFAIFFPDAEPERTAASLARRLGALGSMAFDVVGAMWSRPQLSRRDRSLMIISVLAAQARDEELIVHTRIGLAHGLVRAEIEEILLFIAALAGFPAAMAASRRVDAALKDAEDVERLEGRTAAKAKSDDERDADAARFAFVLAAGEGGAALARLEAASGEAAATAWRWLLGEIWSREVLADRDKAIVTLAVHIALGATDDLPRLARAALRLGLTRADMDEMTNHLALYAGAPRALAAARAIRRAVTAKAP
ncbi:MAG TPA: carboxymuconolactone decarboxylase family protein [Caulobacteraceae bacterium]|nr:carboxymuconolactone decarboxylase family protein [Caulobacteraceae bacterium]